MALLTVQTVALAGTLPTYAAASALGDTAPNNGRTFLVVKNANAGASRTVTINSLVNCDQGFDHDVAVTIAQSTEKWIGPFPPSRFNSSSGTIAFTYDDETDITVAAISI